MTSSAGTTSDVTGNGMCREDILEDEWYHVRYSGEIPEIALHSTLYHLTEDQEGPGLALRRDELDTLLAAAAERYVEIILRDITPANRDKSHYRGILRSISNWRRYKRFCRRHGRDAGGFVAVIGEATVSFLENEVHQVQAGQRRSCINCSFGDLRSFALELDVSLDHMAAQLPSLCTHFS